MSKIAKYAQTSQLMDIEISVGEEKVKFNLNRELRIKDEASADELMKQPSNYGFLTMLHKNLIKSLGILKIEEKKAYASAYIKYKKATNKETGRPNSDDVAKQLAELDPRYLLKQRKVIETQFDVNRVEACVRGFEQRKDMLQTLSANNRKERM